MKPVDKSVIERCKDSLRHQGLRTTVFKLFVLVVDYLYDLNYGTDTITQRELDDLTIGSENKERGVRYQPTKVMLLRKLFENIKPIIPADPVIVDLGCGKGRVLLVASEFGFRDARGIEFAPELCKIARDNCAIYKNRTGISTDFQIIEADVADYRISSDENIFFMFNPFDEVVLIRFLDHVIRSLEKQPRKILIIYYNPEYGEVIEHHDRFAKLKALGFWGNRITIYSNSVQSSSGS